MSDKLKALSMLWLVPVIWGFTFPIIHLALHDVDANLFVFWRFLIAGVFLFPVLILSILGKNLHFRDLKYGLILGVVNSGAFIFQGVALVNNSSSQVAFLTGVNVVLVPFLLPLFGLGRPKFIEICAAAMCLFGVYLVSGADLNGFSYEDILVLTSALCIAIGIIIVEQASVKSNNLRLLTFYQIIFTSITPFIVLRGHVFAFPFYDIKLLAILIYCAVFATVMALFIQIKYQPLVGSNKSAIIFSMEAVFATMFAHVFGEHITLNIVIGGVIIVFSSMIVDVFKVFRK